MRFYQDFGAVPIEIIEAPHDLAPEFEMRHLIASHRHAFAAHDRHVAQLQQRITQESSGGNLHTERFDLSLEGRDAFQPRDRRDHREQRVEFGDLRDG